MVVGDASSEKRGTEHACDNDLPLFPPPTIPPYLWKDRILSPQPQHVQSSLCKPLHTKGVARSPLYTLHGWRPLQGLVEKKARLGGKGRTWRG